MPLSLLLRPRRIFCPMWSWAPFDLRADFTFGLRTDFFALRTVTLCGLAGEAVFLRRMLVMSSDAVEAWMACGSGELQAH